MAFILKFLINVQQCKLERLMFDSNSRSARHLAKTQFIKNRS